MTQGKPHREPLLRIAKRDGIARPKAWAIRIIAVLLSLVVSGIFIFAVTKLNPFQVYEGIFDGAFGTPRRSWVTVRDAMMLLCIGVGLAPAFKMRFWNIGGEGQFILGAVAAAAVALLFFLQPEESNFLTASVVLEGETIAEYELSTLTGPVTLVVDEAPYPLTIQAEPGRIRIAESACPSQDCVHTGWISRAGQQIICLPDKLVISLSGSGSQEFDAISG